MTGTPAAIASTTTTANVSSSDGKTNTVALAYSEGISDRFHEPGKLHPGLQTGLSRFLLQAFPQRTVSDDAQPRRRMVFGDACEGPQ